MKSNNSAAASAAKRPSLFISLIPVLFLLSALIGIIICAGSGSISDYSPLILLLSAAVSVVLSVVTRTAERSKMIHGFRRSAAQILPAVPLLLLIALVSATWLWSGVVPTLIDYGIRLLNPTFFLVTTCAVCAVVSVLTGSSWSTIATIGVAFIGIGSIMGYDEAWIAGAIISGAYFGDKVSPLSDTTVIASSSCGVDLFEHIRYLMLTATPAMVVSLIVFFCVGLTIDVQLADAGHEQMLDALHGYFIISPVTLIIPAIVFALIALRVKTLYTLAAGAVLGLAGIFVFQPEILATIAQNGLSGAADVAKTTLRVLWTETSLHSGIPELDDLISSGGIMGMMPTITLVLCAMLFGGAMLGTGMLATIAEAITGRLKHRRSIVGATVSSGLFLNACTADQYLSIIIGSNMYRDVYQRYSFEPRLLSRTLEDSISVTSVLIPWNSCGVTQSTVLGVATFSYLPFCLFNILSPVMTMIMAWTGFRIPQYASSANGE